MTRKLLSAFIVWAAMLGIVAVQPVSAVVTAPTIGTATETGTTTATVAFVPGATDDGTNLTYSVTSTPAGGSGSGSGSPISVTGLSPNTAYTFRVTASNDEDGAGPPSAPSNQITTDPVISAPGAPTIGTASPTGQTTATVAFTPGSTGGGSGLTYSVTSTPAGGSGSGSGSPISVTGLSPNTAYTFTVTASNSEAGSGPASGSSNSITTDSVITAPGAPTIGTATKTGTTTATVAFAPGSTGGGSGLTYSVTSSPAGGSGSGSGSPISVSGLSPNTAYTFTVTASNSEAGSGPASGSSNSITTDSVITAPGAPTIGTATKTGTTTATVAFAPGSTGGGSGLTYSVTSSPAGGSGSGSGSPISVSGLSPDTAYTFRVTASNSEAGAGPASAPSNSITTDDDATTPGQPTNVRASLVGTNQARVTFNAPGNNGGSNITEYRVTSSPGNKTATGTGSPITVTGLDPGTTYSFRVVAINGVGPSGQSQASNNIQTPSVPGAPRNVQAGRNGSNGATISFAAPTSDGGSGVTSYTVTASPGGRTASGNGSPISLSGLDAGQTYTFTVRATNAIGTGSASNASNSVTMPRGPGAPGGVSAALNGTDAATVAFNPPSDNGGSNITQYTVTASPGGRSASGSTSPIVVTGLDSNTTYTFTVRASNDVGQGPASGESNSIKTPGRPNAPTSVNAILAGNTSATVSFDAPNSNGAEISEFTVVASPGGIEATGSSSPIEVTGLQPGETYTFRVFATNSVGDGGGSAPSDGLFVPIVPGLALITEVTSSAPYSSSIMVTWEPPLETGGAPVTQYVVAINGVEKTAGPDDRSVSFDGVSVGTHTPTLVAITIAGRGPVSTGPEVEVRAFAPFDSEESFIAQLYRDILGRNADQAGLDYWGGLTADDGSNVAEIIRSFMFSSEFDSRRAIARLYLAFFDRRPDIGGFDYWADQINSGQANLDTISESFVKSKEFQETYGSLSDQNFIRLVYNNVLVREPDQAGYDFWLVQLNAGMTRGELMTRFSESPEFVAGTRPAVDVIVTYRSMLNRPPDDAGFVFWLGQIAGDPNAITSLISGFYSSQEYADRISR